MTERETGTITYELHSPSAKASHALAGPGDNGPPDGSCAARERRGHLFGSRWPTLRRRNSGDRSVRSRLPGWVVEQRWQWGSDHHHLSQSTAVTDLPAYRGNARLLGPIRDHQLSVRELRIGNAGCF